MIDNKFKLCSTYDVACYRDNKIVWTESSPNLVVNEGLAYVMGTSFGDVDQIEWRCGLVLQGTPTPEDTMQSHPYWTEFTGTYIAVRPPCEFVIDSDPTKYISSSSQFMIQVSSQIAGAFMTSEPDSTSTNGTLYGVSNFEQVRQVVNGDALFVTITVGAKA